MAFSTYASIHDLATETIGEIFAASASDPHCPFDANALPYQLTKVCSRWRNVALATPALWSNILIDWDVFLDLHWLQPDSKKWMKGREDYLPPPEKFFDAAKKTGPLLEAWMSRTGHATLHVTIKLRNYLNDLPAAMCDLGADFLYPLASRLLSLKLVSCYEILEELMYDVWVLPQLRELDVNAVLGSIKHDMVPMQLDTPRLRNLSMATSLRMQVYDPTSFPWSQLSSLKISLHPDNLRNQLFCLRLAADTIEELHLFDSSVRDPHYDPQQPNDLDDIKIHFPQLRTLVVSGYGGVGDELDCFIAMPAVKVFRLDIDRVGKVHWDKLTRLLKRVNFELDWFYLDVTGINRCSKADLRNILRAVPSTKKFSFRSERQKRVETMVGLMSSGCGNMKKNLLLLPEMTELEILGHEPKMSSHIVEMVDSRLEAAGSGSERKTKIPVATITRLGFRERPEGQHQKMRKAIARWRERGISVSMELDTSERSSWFRLLAEESL